MVIKENKKILFRLIVNTKINFLGLIMKKYIFYKLIENNKYKILYQC